ncbi:HAD family hydrolase [Gallibacterium salpingitidis]|uniref:HAD family hydrolase n=1 Tax=Gallibacterium salpingitidis TaxID=505341 RepID=A0AB36E355_9PAST|nr:HAD-IA family hydrolase [Gallibacterium salpingitidis]OBX07323.1 HAD family hydrolase [Gallibacterium salpingitidis]OBX10735.1 HAD family hydrolase [Gallibacterium salpingitidis]WKS98976.1 HAD-IA family hydrolase [Gallibacterium salpingitidis]
MLHFYRNLLPPKVITFDLDDTLYDNYFVIRNAEQVFLECLQQLADVNVDQWADYKQQMLQEDPVRYEDVIAWRIAAATRLLQQQGKTGDEINKIIATAMEQFVESRHKIDVPKQNQQFLTELAKVYPLVSISNGNVYPPRIGLNQFQLMLRGGEHGRAKPHIDLFQQTADYFHCNINEILHVGDNLITDVQGAIINGCQAVWVNTNNQPLTAFPEATHLPTLAVSDVTELNFLLK